MLIYTLNSVYVSNVYLYTNRRSEAQRKLMPCVAGYMSGRARLMGPLQRLGRNCDLPLIVEEKPQPIAKREIQGWDYGAS